MIKMKKIIVFVTAIGIMLVASQLSHGETKMVTASGSATADIIFSLEFYQDANVFFTTSIPFTSMDALSTHVMADGRQSGDGKNDTGLLCRTNTGQTWYFKVGATFTPSNLQNKLKYYFGRPWNRSYNPPWGGASADGTLVTNPPEWVNLPAATSAVYIAGPHDLSNLPGGTLCLFSFAIDASALDATVVYNSTITYTLSEAA